MESTQSPTLSVTDAAQCLRGFAWKADGHRSHDPLMDTLRAHRTLFHSPPPAPPGVPPVEGWERLLPGAVAQAWQHDPETMGGLLATLLAQHMAGRTHCMDETLDELQLMISMELQALAGYPD